MSILAPEAMKIRPLTVADASNFLTCLTTIDATAPYMLYEPGERQWNVEIATSVIEQTSQLGILLGVFDQHKMIGYLLLQGSPLLKIRHTAQIVLGLNAEYRGYGLGTRLFEAAFTYAKEAQLSRLELSVLPQNTAAYHLYTKLGFFEEGVRKAAILQDGQLIDEIMMAKLID